MKKLISILLFSITLGLYAQEGEIKIVENKKSQYNIVIVNNNIENDVQAATLLQKSIKDICGTKLKVTNKQESQGGKSFIICSKSADKDMSHYYVDKNGDVCLFGRNAYYSVVDFLERELGMRMFSADCITYKPIKNFSLKNNTHYEYTSPNTFRQVNSAFTKNSKEFKHWLKSHIQDDMFAKGFYVHTAETLLPHEQYFQSNPECFALVNGQRSWEQPCWTNEKTFDIMRDNLAKHMSLQPDMPWWSVSQNDNDAYCHCDKCMELIEKEGSAAAPIIYFVNKMAKAFPDKTISTLAYIYSRKAPKTLKPAKNVQIMLCTIEANRNITIEEEKHRHPNGCFANDLEDWGKLTNNIFLWDYECDFAYYISPFPNFHVLQPNIQYFVENGATMQFQQANCQTGNDFSELKNYLLAKLIWDPYLNQDSIVNEFLSGYYGPAAAKIRQYMDYIDSVALSYKDNVSLDIYGAPIRYADNIFSQRNLYVYDSIMQDAENLVKGDKKYLLRVQTVRLAIDYAIMEIAKSDMFGPRGWYTQHNGKYVLKKQMKQRLEKFYSVCKKSNVTHINERGLTPKTYYESTLNSIDIDVENNLAFHKKVTVSPDANTAYCKGEAGVLTDGAKGADDYHMNWLGWWGPDFEVVVDLEQEVRNKSISISSLHVPASWILHPNKVTCLVSLDGEHYTGLGSYETDGYNRENPTLKQYNFKCKSNFRYVKFIVKGTNKLPAWHVSYNKNSWVFVDEIIVK